MVVNHIYELLDVPDVDVHAKTRIHRKTLRKTQRNILIPKYKLRKGPNFTFSLPGERFDPTVVLSTTPLRLPWTINHKQFIILFESCWEIWALHLHGDLLEYRLVQVWIIAKRPSRAEWADSSKAYSKPKAFNGPKQNFSPAPATMIAGAFLAITCQSLELKSCLN